MSLGSNGVDRARSLQKILKQLYGTNFCNNMLHRVSCRDKMVSNAPKHYKMHVNLSFGSNGADNLRSLRKIPMRLHGTKFCINCSSARFTRSFVVQQNYPKCTQMVRNTPRHVFRFQSFGLGLFLRKILMRLHGMIFYISCISSDRSAPSFVQ